MIGNVRPSGNKYLMEDFFYAGGIRALMGDIREHLNLDCLTVTGRTLGENIDGARVYDADVIRAGGEPDLRRRLAGGAARQPGALRLRHQAGRDGPALPEALAARRWCSTTTRP